MNKEFTDDSISFRQLIDHSINWIKFFWTKKWRIILASVFMACILSLYAYLSPPIYQATSTFIVKEDDGGSIAGLNSILSSIGLSGTSRSKFNLDKVVSIAQSKKILSNALMDSVTIDGKMDLMGNFLVEKYNLLSGWEKTKTAVQNFKRFEQGDTSLAQNAALNSIYYLVSSSENKKRLLDASFDEFSSIISLKVTSISEPVSRELSRLIYKNLADFYISQSTEKARRTIDTLERNIALVKRRLENKESILAITKDRSLGLYMENDLVPEKKINRDYQISNVMYSELVRNLATAKFSLQTATPVFQPIDVPEYPLFPIKKSLKLFGILGFFLGGFLSMGILYLQRLYRDY